MNSWENSEVRWQKQFSRLSWHAEWTFSGGVTHGSQASRRRASFLWRGGGKALLFRFLSSYVCENRASWNGGAGLAEKCAWALTVELLRENSKCWTNVKYKESSGIAPPRVTAFAGGAAGGEIRRKTQRGCTQPARRHGSSATAQNQRTRKQRKHNEGHCTTRAAFKKRMVDEKCRHDFEKEFPVKKFFCARIFSG